MDKQTFINKCKEELGGGFLAELDGEVLWACYEKIQHENNADSKASYRSELSAAIGDALYHAKQRKEIKG